MIELKDFPKYFACEDGRIWSENGRWGQAKFLSTVIGNAGYQTVCVSNEKKRTKSVHVLICEAFHGSRPEGLQAAHINGNRLDNRPENLMWKSLEENYADREIHGNTCRGERNGMSKLTWKQVNEIRVLNAFWRFTTYDLASTYNISQAQAFDIVKFKSRKTS